MPRNSNGRATGSNPSMEDVARLAGVALGTVSNVFNRPHAVSEVNRTKVERAVEQLGYVRNRAARSLAGGSSNTIGFVIIDLSNSYFLDMARGAEDEAQRSGLSVLLANSNMQLEKQDVYLNLFEEERVAGVLVAPIPDSFSQIHKLRARGARLVLLNDPNGGSEFCHVLTDNELGGYLAARHLIDTGRRKLLFAGGPERLGPIRDRRAGVERAVAESNGSVRLEFLGGKEVQVADGRKLGHHIAKRARNRRPDGVVAASDLLAVGILQTLMTESDIRVPDDMSLIGYDNNRAAWDSVIPISTVDQPGDRMGGAAARLLLDEILDPEHHHHQRVVLEPHVLIRDSSKR